MTEEELDEIDDSTYDVESIRIDIGNNNFSGDVEIYRYETIIQNSIINGQHSQAREQCREFGFDYDEQKRLVAQSQDEINRLKAVQ